MGKFTLGGGGYGRTPRSLGLSKSLGLTNSFKGLEGGRVEDDHRDLGGLPSLGEQLPLTLV